MLVELLDEDFDGNDTNVISLGKFEFPDNLSQQEFKDLHAKVLPKARNLYDAREGAPSFKDMSRGFVDNIQSFKKNVKEHSALSHAVRWAVGSRTKKEMSDEVITQIKTDISTKMSELEEENKQDTIEYKMLEHEFDGINNLLTEVPEFSFSALTEAVTNDPGTFFAELTNIAMGSPEMAFLPIGWAKAARAATTAAGKLAAGSSAAFAIGAGIGAPASALRQLDEKGFIDPNQVLLEGGIEGGVGVLMGGLGHIFTRSAPRAIARSSQNVTEQDVKNAIESAVVKDTEIDEFDKAARLDRIKESAAARKEKFLKKIQADKERAALDARIAAEQASTPKKKVTQTSPLLRDKKGRFISPTKLKAALEDVGVKEPVADTWARILTRPMKAAGKESQPELMKRLDPRVPKEFSKFEKGFIDPRAAILLGGAALGTLYVLGSEDKLKATATVGGFAAGLLGLKYLLRNFTRIATAKSTAARATQRVIDFDGRVANAELISVRSRERIRSLVPNKGARNTMVDAMDGNRVAMGLLTPPQRAVVSEVRNELKKLSRVLSSLEKTEPGELKRRRAGDIANAIFKSSISQKEREGLAQLAGDIWQDIRDINDFIPALMRAGQEANIPLKSDDFADIVSTVQKALITDVARKIFIKELMKAPSTVGVPLIVRGNKAPNWYKEFGHPLFANLRIHPDLIPSLKLMFSADDPSATRNAVMAVNLASKRALVSLSGFHMNALFESSIMAGTRLTGQYNPRQVLELLRAGEAGDVVEVALRAGVKIAIPDDVNLNDAFYRTLDDIQRVMDNRFVFRYTMGTSKIAGVGLKGYQVANKVMDKVLWEKVYTSLKLATFAQKYHDAILANPKANPERLAAEIAQFTNDAFGGQNWVRNAEMVDSRYFRRLALDMQGKEGRQWLSLALFAPDWTLSNIRIIGKPLLDTAKTAANIANKALGNKERFSTPARSDRIFRRTARTLSFGTINGIPVTPWERYALRGAVLFAVANEVFQNIFNEIAGEELDKQDKARWDRLELPDGRTQVISKQFTEPFLWLQHPIKELSLKAGVIPKLALEIATGKKWFAVGDEWAPPVRDPGENLAAAWSKHIGKKFLPIWINQMPEQGADALWGFSGHPRYGWTEEMRERDKERKEKLLEGLE